jgi:hypothetical protein
MSVLLIFAPLIYLYATKASFVSFLVAYVTSSLILMASFKSYKSMVDKRLLVDANVAEFDDRDTISKLEDPYNLYSEDEEYDESLSLKEAIKEEKKLLKKNRRDFKSFVKDSSRAFSFLRLGAYAIFVFGFFYLLKGNLLSFPFYLATIIIPNVIVVVYLQIIKGKAS